MRKTELNEIIKKKIMELNDSENMKEFLFEILNVEIQNIEYIKAQYTKDYIESATRFSNKEQRD